MPQQNHIWWHLILSTYASWLPGDPRGFRNRDHRIHSSGDYHYPPPTGEHAGLLRYAKSISGDTIVFSTCKIKERVGRALLKQLSETNHRVLVIAVGRTHVHLLIEYPEEPILFSKLVTKLKTKSSAAVGDVLPGRVWGRGDTRELKIDRAAQLKCFDYVRNDQEKGAWVWTFKEDYVPPEKRKRLNKR